MTKFTKTITITLLIMMMLTSSVTAMVSANNPEEGSTPVVQVVYENQPFYTSEGQFFGFNRHIFENLGYIVYACEEGQDCMGMPGIVLKDETGRTYDVYLGGEALFDNYKITYTISDDNREVLLIQRQSNQIVQIVNLDEKFTTSEGEFFAFNDYVFEHKGYIVSTCAASAGQEEISVCGSVSTIALEDKFGNEYFIEVDTTVLFDDYQITYSISTQQGYDVLLIQKQSSQEVQIVNLDEEFETYEGHVFNFKGHVFVNQGSVVYTCLPNQACMGMPGIILKEENGKTYNVYLGGETLFGDYKISYIPTNDKDILLIEEQNSNPIGNFDGIVELNEKFDMDESERFLVKNANLVLELESLSVISVNDNSEEDPAIIENTAKVLKVSLNKVVGIQQSITLDEQGKTYNAFGFNIKFIDEKEHNVLLLVTKEKPMPIKAPVCSGIGSRSEGWYIDGELIKYDKCSCQAVCKVKGTVEGFYNSCSGQLIMKSRCGANSVVNGGSANLEQTGETVSSSVLESVANVVDDDYKESIVIQEGKLAMRNNGVSNLINIQPQQVEAKLKQDFGFTTVSSLELTVENDEAVYRVNGVKERKILWVIPWNQKSSVSVNAETSVVSN